MANKYYCRFNNVVIPNGADIRTCFVRFVAYAQELTSSISLNIYFVDADNPNAPVNKTELDAFSLTSAVAWTNLPAWYDGTQYQTPDFSDLLEVVVGRVGWSSGNNVILVIEDNSSPSDVHRKISAHEYLAQAERPSLQVGWFSSTENFFSNLYWEPKQLNPATPIETSWSGTVWNFNINADSDGGRLVARGTWWVGYQPKEITIYHTHAGTPELKVYASDGIIHHSLAYTSGTVITPLWAGRSGGIWQFEFLLTAGDNASFTVTDITYNSEAPAAQTTTSTSSTASTTSSSSSTISTISSTSSSTSTISTTSSISTSSGSTTTSSSTSTMSTTGSTISTVSTLSTHTSFSTTTTISSSSSTTSSSSSTNSTSSTTSSSSSTNSTSSTTSSSSSTNSTSSTISTSSSTTSTTNVSTTTTTTTSTSTSSSTSSTASTLSTTTTLTSTSSTASTLSTTTTLTSTSSTASTLSTTTTLTSTSSTASTLSTTTTLTSTSSTASTLSTTTTLTSTSSTASTLSTTTTLTSTSSTASTLSTTTTLTSTSSTASTLSTTTSTLTSSSTSSTASTLSTTTSTLTSSSTSSTASTLSTTTSTSTSTFSTTSTTTTIPPENLSTYTVVDENSNFTITALKAAFDTMRQDVVSYVYYDFGANYFGDFEVDFEAEITVSVSAAQMIACGFSNTIGAKASFVSANDGITIALYNDGSNLVTSLQCQNTDNSDNYLLNGSTSPLRYYTFKRVGTTTTLSIYSNSSRTNLVDTLTITSESGNKRYFYVLTSQSAGAAATITGYTQYFYITNSG